jgi:anthranilate phosphoribosyltransferase
MDQTALKEFGATIDRVIQKKPLTEEEAYTMFRAVLLNEQPDLQQGAFLAALVAKGETVEELAGAWRAIYEVDTVHASDDLPKPLFENSGTGMDGIKTFNVSSAAAIVAAAAGVRIARHGARAITSVCGAVDIMEAVGINVECDVKTVEKSILQAGIGLFNGMSPKVHPGGLGRILSQIRFGSTLNIAASLAHPCRPAHGLRGVYSETIMEKVAETMRRVGYERGMVVFGKDDATNAGMDELSITGETLAIEFTGNSRSKITFSPEDVGLKRARTSDILSTGNLADEADRFLKVLSGTHFSACIDFTCLNAGAILYTAGKCSDLKTGVDMSRETLETGRAFQKLQEWRAEQGRDPQIGIN